MDWKSVFLIMAAIYLVAAEIQRLRRYRSHGPVPRRATAKALGKALGIATIVLVVVLKPTHSEQPQAWWLFFALLVITLVLLAIAGRARDE